MQSMAPTTCSSVSARSGSTRPTPTFRSRTAPSSSSTSLAPSSSRNSSGDVMPQQAKASDRKSNSMSSSGNGGVIRTGSGSTTTTSSSKTPRKTNNGTGVSKASRGGGGNGGKKSVYKHVPHALKPVHLVAKRNARERRRVQAVNSAFLRLRKHVPYEPRHKRLSKVKTLRVAITYISHLQEMIRDHDRRMSVPSASSQRQHPHPLHHPSHHHHHHQHHHSHHHPLNMLAEAASSSAPVSASAEDGAPQQQVFDNGYHHQFLNGACAEEAPSISGGGGGSHHRSVGLHHHHHHHQQQQHHHQRLHHHQQQQQELSSSESSPPMSTTSSAASSHFLAQDPAYTAGQRSVTSSDPLAGGWTENLQYTGPVDGSKVPACPSSEPPVYFFPSCPPQHYDVTGNGSYLPYDSFSVQSPYPLLR